MDNKFSEDFKKAMADEDAIKRIYLKNRYKCIPKFDPELKKLFMDSKALMYPQLLPEIPFRSELNKFVRPPYLKSEERYVNSTYVVSIKYIYFMKICILV